MFAKLISVSMEVYIDDMLVKSMCGGDYVNNINQVFLILRKFRVKLIPANVHLPF